MMAVGYLTMCLIFGTTYMAIKFGINDGMPPILMATLRFGIASVLLLAYYFLRRISFPKGWKTHAEIALLGGVLVVNRRIFQTLLKNKKATSLHV